MIGASVTRGQAAAALRTIDHADSDWIGAMRSRDVERIVEPYDRDGMFVTSTGTVIRGRDSIAALYRRRLTAVKRISDGAIVRDGLQAVNDSLVYEWGHGGMTFTDTSGVTHTSRGPYLTVWRRESDGAWRIIRNLVF
ncbi:MAG TPA: SgcJ/EcaC family oxidoreductase [Gemmatimonadaceae bacterium]|nr:SgcJ/EcaC family oxidoreductase [Gemmatimonadaceae bacterium]